MYSQRELFCIAEYINDFKFAADGSLAYIVAKRHRGAGKKELLELHRWYPNTQQSEKVWAYESINPRTLNREIDPETQVAFVDCKLSPDAQTILLATYEKDTIQGKLIDGYSGVSRTAFTIHPNHPQELMLADVQVMFASDSKSIVVQTCEIHGIEKHYYWHCVNVQSSQVREAISLPEGVVTPEFFFGTASSPVSKAINRQGDHLLITFSNKQFQVIQLDEVKPTPSMTDQHKIQTHIISFEQTPENDLIAYYWTHFRRINSTTTEFLPGVYWAIRDLVNGNLLHTSRVDAGSEQQSIERRYYYNLVNILPGPTLVFMQGNVENDKVNGLLNEYLTKLRNWLGIHQDKSGKMLFINGTSGEIEKQLQLPHGQMSEVDPNRWTKNGLVYVKVPA